MRPGSSAEYNELRHSLNHTVTLDEIRTYGQFVADTANIIYTLPTPTSSHHQYEAVFTNASTGFISVMCDDSMVDGSDGFILKPGEEITIRCTQSGSSTYAWATNRPLPSVQRWQAWTPTLSWTTATPTLATSIHRYCVIDGVCLIYGYMSTTDGAGATDLTITLPFVPPDVDIEIPLLEAADIIDGTDGDLMGYIDCANNTAENRLIEFHNFTTWTDDAACSMMYSGFYPVDESSWNTTASPTETWTTGTPGSITNTMIHKVVGDVVFVAYSTSSADSNACTELTVALPVPLRDKNDYVACRAIQLNNATYSNPLGYLDGTANTDAARLFEMDSFTTVADGQAVAVTMAAIYEAGDTWYTHDGTPTWSTASPSSVSEVSRYTAIGPVCFWTGYLSSSDGNGATNVTFTPPIAPAYSSAKMALANRETQHTDTFAQMMAYLDGTSSTVTSRVLTVDDPTTADDGEACSFAWAGFYEICP